jgi:SPW repeat
MSGNRDAARPIIFFTFLKKSGGTLMSGKSLVLQRREAVLDVYTLLCGLFLLAAPWLFGFVRPSGRLDAQLVGLAVAGLSAAAIFLFAKWEEWLKLGLGVWLIVAPWVLGFVHTSAMHVSIGVGVIVTFLAVIELWIVHNPEDFA